MSRLIVGDALDVLPTLAEESIDAVVTDPPYSSGGMVRGDRMGSTRKKYTSTDSEAADDVVPFSGDNRDQLSWVLWSTLWMMEARRTLKQGGTCVVFTDWRQLPATIQAMQCAGLVFRGIVPWHKPSARPQKGRFSAACEFAVWGSNGPMATEGDCIAGFVSAQPAKMADRDHLTQKPVAVMEHLLRIVPAGGVVLDPFMGSGTTGVACVRTGRGFIGIDIDQHWHDVAARRMKEEAPMFNGGAN